MTLLVPISVANIMLEDARHDECIGLRPVINERIALGTGPRGLGVACHFCYPSLITAHTFVDDRPCCWACACDERRHCSFPSFLQRGA